jgi:hypothetical protein
VEEGLPLGGTKSFEWVGTTLAVGTFDVAGWVAGAGTEGLAAGRLLLSSPRLATSAYVFTPGALLAGLGAAWVRWGSEALGPVVVPVGWEAGAGDASLPVTLVVFGFGSGCMTVRAPALAAPLGAPEARSSSIAARMASVFLVTGLGFMGTGKLPCTQEERDWVDKGYRNGFF